MFRKSPTYKADSFTTLVVTGGSSGIGNTFIGTLLRINPRVRVFNLSRTFFEKNFPTAQITHIAVDLSDANALADAANELIAMLEKEADAGPILLINNAGFGSYGPFPEPSNERQQTMIALNVCAPVNLTARLLPLLCKRKGAVINVASTAAFQPTPWLATYGATKSFLLNWSLSLARELRPEGIQVLAVCPGPTSTNFFRSAGFDSSPLPQGLGHTTEQVVAESLKALEKGKVLVVTGLSNKLLTLVSSRLPKPLVAALSDKILARIRLSR